MPTTKPRLMVTLSEEQHELLLRMGKLQGKSAGWILKQLVDNATPTLKANLPILEAAAKAMAELPDQMRVATAAALKGVYGDESDQIDLEAHIASLSPSGAPQADGEDGADRSVSEDRTARTARQPSKRKKV